MKRISISAFFIIYITSCVSNYHEEIHYCFNSKDKAREIGLYLTNKGFSQRTRSWLSGNNKPIDGLGFLWDGFESDALCPIEQHALKIIYEPQNKQEIEHSKVMPSAKLTYKLMLEEYNL